MQPIVAKLGLTAMALAGLGFLVKSSLDHGQHMNNLDELTAQAHFETWGDTQLKVAGWVQAGSIVERIADQETYRTFVERGMSGRTMRVFSTGPKPDTFKDNSEVVTTGRVVPAREMMALATRLGVKLEPGEWVLDASELSAKCPSRYEGARTGSSAKDLQY